MGKASSLRSRLTSYFQSPERLTAKTAQMVSEAERVEWIQVRNEHEAIMLEYNLIKLHRPRFNIALRDDKSYPYLALTKTDKWPRVRVVREAKRKGTKYFGPYANAGAIRETLGLAVRSCPVRTCTDSKFASHERLGRPCLLFHIEQCCGPCTGKVSKEQYDDLVGNIERLLDGRAQQLLAEMKDRMKQASSELRFEEAAKFRDRIATVETAMESQQMVSGAEEDFDLFGVHGDELEASIQVFRIRKGRMIGRKGFIFDKPDELSGRQVIEFALENTYADRSIEVPSRLYLPEMPEDEEGFVGFLSELRGEGKSPVKLLVPMRGDKRRLLETAVANAKDELFRARLRRGADLAKRSEALTELQSYLNLPCAPLRIECFDMSHLQGTDYVGSMVVTEDGIPKRSEYRRFKVRSNIGNDDYSAMREVLIRRLKHLVEVEAGKSSSGKLSRAPDLLVVDGGKGQLGVACEVVSSLGLVGRFSLASLAKKFEEVYVPEEPDPREIPRNSEALYMLQRLRDESHRFAITYHRNLRTKRMTASVLDDVDGVGAARKKRLIKHFGSVKVMKAASKEELLEIPWLPDSVGEAVYDRLHGLGEKATGFE